MSMSEAFSITCSFVITRVVWSFPLDTNTPLPPLVPDMILTTFLLAISKIFIAVAVGVGVKVGRAVGVGVFVAVRVGTGEGVCVGSGV